MQRHRSIPDFRLIAIMRRQNRPDHLSRPNRSMSALKWRTSKYKPDRNALLSWFMIRMVRHDLIKIEMFICLYFHYWIKPSANTMSINLHFTLLSFISICDLNEHLWHDLKCGRVDELIRDMCVLFSHRRRNIVQTTSIAYHTEIMQSKCTSFV